MSRFLSFTCCLLVVVAVRAGAQPQWSLDKGSVIIGGHISFAQADGEAQGFTTRTDAELSPFAYYCVTPYLGIGGTAVLSSSKRTGVESSSQFLIGPGVVTWIADSTSTMYPYFGLTLYWASLVSESSGATETSRRELSGFAVELTGGATYLIGRHVGISGQLYYQIQRVSEAGDEQSGRQWGYRIGLMGFIF